MILNTGISSGTTTNNASGSSHTAADLHSPYRDAFGRPSEGGADYDPYNSTGAVRHHSSDQRM